VVDVVGRLRPEGLVARLHEGGGFGGGEELAVGELRGPFERRVRRVAPVAGEVRRAVTRPRRSVRLRRLGDQRKRPEGNRGDGGNDNTHARPPAEIIGLSWRLNGFFGVHGETAEVAVRRGALKRVE